MADIYFCNRCNEKFTDYEDLVLHWKRSTPCDFICTTCGTRMTSTRTYQKHKKSNCDYKPKYSKQGDVKLLNLCTETKDEKINTKNSSPNPSPSSNTNPSPVIHHIPKTTNYYNNTKTINKNTGDVNYINININNLTINPHTQEMKIDKEKLLGDIVEKILFRMDTGISGKANWGTMAFTDSFHQMFAHIYGNNLRPENQNLLLKDETTRELQIFDGKAFVDDKLTSEERMLKVIHFIGDGLRWMVENCDNYTVEEKEAKTEKIGRVLSGIPRFKMTYKAMFDNIFNTLKDVREQILERTKLNEYDQIE